MLETTTPRTLSKLETNMIAYKKGVGAIQEDDGVDDGIMPIKGNALNFVTLTNVEMRDRWLELELHRASRLD
jgi:hypothetical protein